MKKSKRLMAVLFAVIMVLSLAVSPASAFSDKSGEIKRINNITASVLSSENGTLFNTYSIEEMKYVLENSPENAGKILDYYDSIAIPVGSNDNSNARIQSQKEYSSGKHSTATKNILTGKESLLNESEFYQDSGIISIEPENINGNQAFSTSLTRSVDWMEYNPQNWADTRTIFKLFIYSGSSVYIGSSFRLKDNHLGTAGHCVYDEVNFGGWADEILCVPAWRAGEPYQPYGNKWSNWMECGGEWRLRRDINDDWGVIHLDGSINVGNIGRRTWGDTTNHDGEAVRVAGYRADGSAMRLSWGNVTSTGRRRVLANYSSGGGQSGGPITDADGYVVGIHRDSGPGFIKLDVWIFNKFNSY